MPSEDVKRMQEFADSLPDWDVFIASVKNEEFGFSLNNLAWCFAIRRIQGIEPIYINPITEKQFDQRTLKRIFAKLDELVKADLLPEPLSFGWRGWDGKTA